MSIESILKNEGISIVRELDKQEVKTIAKDISIKLCLSFPEHSLSRKKIYDALSSIKMYLATLPNDYSGAKYILDNNSIYFNNKIPFEDIPSTAMHECIHFIQHYNTNDDFGLSNSVALNEAAVQLMASEANMNGISNVKYFDISLNTISPDYYPLECALLNQVAYFTGTFPLYCSVLYSNDIFQNTFTTKFNKKMYTDISAKLDEILVMENELNYYIEELSYATSKSKIDSLNKTINYRKQKITILFFKTQNYIMKNCFKCEFNHIKTLEDLHDFKNKLYQYKNIIGYNDNYTFYNDFYCSMMNALSAKKEYLIAHGSKELTSESTELIVIDSKRNIFTKAKDLFKKLKEIFKSDVNKDYINE